MRVPLHSPNPGNWPARGVGPREAVREGVFWPARRDRRGIDGPTAWATRSGQWRRVGCNLWVPADIDPTDADQRIVEAASLLSGWGGVSGWAALRWCGARWFTGDRAGEPLPVPLATGSGQRVRPHPGVLVSQEVIAPRDRMRWDGVRVARPLWAVAFEMRYALSDEAAIVAFEMAAFNDLVSVAELTTYADWLAARRGIERLRRVLSYLDENAWSPMEPIMRRVWETAIECPRPLTNRPVFDFDGRFIGTPDCIDPVAGVAGEYNGAVHLAGEAHYGDVVREAEFQRVGIEPVTMLAGDLADRSAFIQRLRAAYARAARRPASDRRWTLETPSWWRDTTTVDGRRALTAEDRDRLLAHRQRAA